MEESLKAEVRRIWETRGKPDAVKYHHSQQDSLNRSLSESLRTVDALAIKENWGDPKVGKARRVLECCICGHEACEHIDQTLEEEASGSQERHDDIGRILVIARDVNDWLKKTDREGTAHQRSLEQIIDEIGTKYSL